MTDNALDVLASKACDPLISVSELRRVALVAIGELSMLRNEYALLRERGIVAEHMAELNVPMADPALEVPIV